MDKPVRYKAIVSGFDWNRDDEVILWPCNKGTFKCHYITSDGHTLCLNRPYLEQFLELIPDKGKLI